MDILKELPLDIQKIIYNDYLEKQREYHINKYKYGYRVENNSKLPYIEELKRNQNHTNDLLFETYIRLDEEELYDKINELFLEYFFQYNKYMVEIKYIKYKYSKKDICIMRGDLIGFIKHSPLPYIEEFKKNINYIHKCWEFKQYPNNFGGLYICKLGHPHYAVFNNDGYEHFYFREFCEKYVQERTGEDIEFLNYETTRNMITEYFGDEIRFLWKTPNKNYKYKNTQHFTKFRELGYLFVDSDDED